jgi:sulfur carrier protein ThiS
VPIPDGKITGNATVTIGDALRTLQIAVGLIAPTPIDLIHGDVAPLLNGKPAPDGIIDSRDALIILRAVAGLVTL